LGHTTLRVVAIPVVGTVDDGDKTGLVIAMAVNGVGVVGESGVALVVIGIVIV
jgi:hypothetical protein